MNLFDTFVPTNFLMPLLIGGIFVLAGVVKGLIGLGLPTISMALLALMMAPAEAAALLIVPSLVTNLWQLSPWNTLKPMLRRLSSMQVGICFGTWVGAWMLGAPAGAWATISLGVALIVYAVWGLYGASFDVPSKAESWLGPLIGAITGLVTAATGVFAIPAVPYLQALKLQRDELIQAMGISFTVSTIALAIGLYLNGRYSGAALGTSFWMLLPAVGGMGLGQILRQKLSPAVFRKLFLGSLLLLGLYMIGHELLTQRVH